MEVFKLFGSIFVNTDDADKSLQKTEKNAEGLATKFGNGVKAAAKWGAAIAAAAVAIGSAIGGKAVSAAADFEQSFAKVNTLLSNTTDIEKYKKEIIALSNETGIATEELSEAIYSAMSAGVDETEAIKFTAEALKLAEGGFTDTATAVDVMTTAINAYGLSASDASQISDYLITTQNLGKTTVDELASSLGKVIPVASAYGVQLDDLSTVMAVMTKNGIATAEATTYTKAMLNELGDSGSDVSAVLKEQTGKTFAELTAEGYSLGDVMEILGESVNGDAGAFNELWSSSEAGIGALSLLGTGAAEYNNVLQEMRDSAGATSTAYDTMHDTLESRTKTLKANVQNMFAEMGSALLPAIEELMDALIDNMPLIQESIGAIAPILADTASKILPVIMDLAQTLLPIILDLINQLLPVIAQIAADILPVLTNLLVSLLPPFIQIVQSLMPLVVTILNAITPLLSLLIERLQPIIQLFVDLLTPIIEVISAALQPLIEIIAVLISATLIPLTEVVKLVGSIFGDVLNGALSNAKAVIDNIIGVFNGIITFLNGIFTGNFKAAFQGIVDIVSNIFGGIVNIVKIPINAIIDLVNAFIGGLNKLKVPDWVPGLGGMGVNIEPIPKLHTGGLVGAGTLISTNEHEPEIVGNYGNKTLVMNNAQIIETMIGAISATMESFIERISDIMGKGASTMGDIIIPVFIGNERIDEVIVNAKERTVRRSGGRANA